jgi:hypothetical protein
LSYELGGRKKKVIEMETLLNFFIPEVELDGEFEIPISQKYVSE